MPKDEAHLHDGQGQLEAELTLAPGAHTLCLQAADGNHVALAGDGMTQIVSITVESAASCCVLTASARCRAKRGGRAQSDCLKRRHYMMAEELARQRFTVPRAISLTLWANYLCAGAVAGAAGGVLARAAMRVVVLILGHEPTFTVGASLGIVMIFAVVGLMAGMLWLGMARVLHLRAATGGVLLAIGLMLLLAGPIFDAATGDLANTDTSTILKFMLLFIPVPLTIAWGTVWGAERLQRHSAQSPARTMPLGSALATVALFVAAFASVMPVIGAAQRHPSLLSDLLNSNAADLATAGGFSRAVAMLTFLAYVALALIALWRQPDNANVRRSVLLALALPTLLLTSAARLPAPLAWLPDERWLLGLVQAAGVAALLGLYLTAGGFAPPRWLVGVAVATWVIATVWLVARPQTRWTEWLLWSMLAATLLLVVVARLRGRGGSTATSLLLALFALCWLALWAAILLMPALQLRLLTGFGVTRVVSIFWLPWLLLPAALISKQPEE